MMWYKYLHLTSIERTALPTSQLHGYHDDESNWNSFVKLSHFWHSRYNSQWTSYNINNYAIAIEGIMP